jgi:uridine phosphorylase
MIKKTELIIRDNGAIYHLNARPGEVAETIILVGDPGRVERVSKHFDLIEHKITNREFVIHTGYLGLKRLSVISTGIGTDNIDIVLNEVDALFNFDFDTREQKQDLNSLSFIRIGTSGSFRPNIPPDAQVFAAYGMGLDTLNVFYADADRVSKTVVLAENDKTLNAYVVPGSNELLGQIAGDNVCGITLTAAGFYGPQSRELRLKPAFADLYRLIEDFRYNDFMCTNMEMETSAIYLLSALLGHKALSCNAILANRVTGEFSSNPRKGVNKLIKDVLDKIA